MKADEFPQIEWDSDQYPTDASLTAFDKAGEPDTWRDAAIILRRELKRCGECCVYASYGEAPGKNQLSADVLHVSFSTGGWSGCEDLIECLLDKIAIRYLHLEWRRGGHYVFEIPAVDPGA